jgi:hypothetical protein
MHKIQIYLNQINLKSFKIRKILKKRMNITSLHLNTNVKSEEDIQGDIAQMVERSLSMREVEGSIPSISIFF